MSKSRRQRTYARKLDAIRRQADELLMEQESKRVYHEPSSNLAYEQAAQEYLMSVSTPEYIEAYSSIIEEMRRTNQATSTLLGRLQHHLAQHRPAEGLGSYRTKRLRKKMYAWREKEMQARGL